MHFGFSRCATNLFILLCFFFASPFLPSAACFYLLKLFSISRAPSQHKMRYCFMKSQSSRRRFLLVLASFFFCLIVNACLQWVKDTIANVKSVCSPTRKEQQRNLIVVSNEKPSVSMPASQEYQRGSHVIQVSRMKTSYLHIKIVFLS